jgi:hypothetical protein
MLPKGDFLRTSADFFGFQLNQFIFVDFIKVLANHYVLKIYEFSLLALDLAK